MMVIYKAEFPNGKVYIGKSKNFESRKKSHYYNSYYLNSNPTKIKRAINKYGFENISWTILFSTTDESLINEKEKEYIIIYDSIKNGYNISNGGDGGDTISNNDKKYDIIKKQLKSKGINPEEYVIITDDLKYSIIDDYVKNIFSIKAIVRKYNISEQRITRFLKSENIEIDKDRCKETNSIKLSNSQIESVISIYKSGKTIKSIAEEKNLTIMIVSRILHDAGVRESKRFKNGKRYDGRQPKKRKLNKSIG
jgi:group I intron endonuclease